MNCRKLIFIVLPLLLTLPSLAQIDDATRQLARDIFKQLIEINTTDSVGNVTTAAEAMAQRLRDAGFPAAIFTCSAPTTARRTWSCACTASGKHKPVLLHRPSRCGRSAPRGLDHRSVPVRREGRLLLRPRHAGHERRRRHHGRPLIRFKREGFVPIATSSWR